MPEAQLPDDHKVTVRSRADAIGQTVITVAGIAAVTGLAIADKVESESVILLIGASLGYAGANFKATVTRRK